MSQNHSGGGGTRTPKGANPADFESAALPVRLRLQTQAHAMQTACAGFRIVPHTVGETGFEPATPASRTQCSTGLSYSPNSTAARATPVLPVPTDREGFEPSRAINPTRFPIVLLKPLGHLSICPRGPGGRPAHPKRRGWDSNPREPFGPDGLANRCRNHLATPPDRPAPRRVLRVAPPGLEPGLF
jgi:hypothetical protein